MGLLKHRIHQNYLGPAFQECQPAEASTEWKRRTPRQNIEQFFWHRRRCLSSHSRSTPNNLLLTTARVIYISHLERFDCGSWHSSGENWRVIHTQLPGIEELRGNHVTHLRRAERGWVWEPVNINKRSCNCLAAVIVFRICLYQSVPQFDPLGLLYRFHMARVCQCDRRWFSRTLHSIGGL